jgi:hypothetical protein
MTTENNTQIAQPKKNRTWLFILIPFIAIATCNYIINTRDENKIIENPEPGDYFVFKGLIGTSDMPFKVKEIKNDTIEFFIPAYEIFDFRINKSEGKVRDLDKENKLYNPNLTIKIPKSTVDSLRKNSEFSARVLDHSNVYLKAVFK